LLEAEIPVKSNDAGALASAPIVYRTTGPGRSALIPAAALAFRRGELVQVHWRITDAPSEWQARLLDRQGRPRADLTMVELPSGSGGARTLVTSLPLASFATGEYVIELSITSGPRLTTHAVAFRVLG
jgi:hypothetical protein